MTEIKPLLTAFERYAYGQSGHTAFVDIIDWMLLPFRYFDNAEYTQKAMDTYTSHPMKDKLTELATIIGELSEDYCDPLGELYMQAISNGHNGQYFTPEHICNMMAQMQIGNESKEMQSVADPACGSGRMLLAAAKINRHLCFYGADLDSTCCKMALLNMLLNSLEGEIAHMNTLSNDFHRGYKVQTALVDGYHMPYYIEFTESKQSCLWLKPVKALESIKQTKPGEKTRPKRGIQGNLFDC